MFRFNFRSKIVGAFLSGECYIEVVQVLVFCLLFPSIMSGPMGWCVV